MKRIGNLYSKIISIDNLILADKKEEKEITLFRTKIFHKKFVHQKIKLYLCFRN